MNDGEPDKTENGPIPNGANARPRDASIASTAPGLPNDGSEPIEVDEKEVAEIENRVRRE